MTKSSEMEAKAAILDKCCQSVECLARGKVFDLVGTLDLPQSSSPETETQRTDWNDIGSICRTFGNERQAVTAIFSGRMTPGRNFWKEAADEIARLRAGLAQTQQQRIAAPGNDQLSKLWNTIVENTKGDGFWIGEILLTTLEREIGFNPVALTDTSTNREGK